MLVIRSITIDGMGPYKERETLEFPDDGVTIVFGENGYGKTSLLNAFRYALYGKVIGRGNRNMPLRNLVNWENAANGKYHFSVVLRFSFEGHEYELTRTCQARSYVTNPTHDGDFVQDCFLRCDGRVLSPDKRDKHLNLILPEPVSRFFLFDGELLQQYEELLRKESDMGREIAASIERILGLPILTKTRDYLSDFYIKASRIEANAAKKHRKTQEKGEELERKQAEQHELLQERERLASQLAEEKRKKEAAEKVLSQHQVAASLISRRDQLIQEIRSLEQELKQKQSELRGMLADAWRWLLADKAREERMKIQASIHSLHQQIIQRSTAEALVQIIQRSLSERICEVCGRSLDPETENLIRERLMEASSTFLTVVREEELNLLKEQDNQLKKLDVPDKSDDAIRTWYRIAEIEAELAVKRGQVDEIERDELVKTADHTFLNNAKSEFEQSVRRIAILEKSIKDNDEKLRQVQARIEELQAELKALGVVELRSERRRREVYDQLYNLFQLGVEEYRRRLREKVEKDATNLFRQLAGDKKYKSLAINENYGLTIVHESGQPITVRSAGYEHVVALALMGALQRNAPLRGPIIMDSPFTRLDRTHRINVLRALPIMARQTMLLVFEDEIEPQLAREELGGKLKAEYRLQRLSSFQTCIVRQ